MDQRVRQSLQQRRDFFVLSLVRRQERFVIHHLRYLMVLTVSLLMPRYLQERTAMSFLRE